MRRLAFAALLLPAAVWAQEPPPALVEATEEATALCRDLGGTPTILEDYATVRDLNGDGREDFVTDLARIECAGAWGAFCGSAGCPVTAWLSVEDGGFERFDLGRLRGFAIRDGEGALPELVASYDASRCDGADAEGCTRTWSFPVTAPGEPPIDARPEPVAAPATDTAAAAPAPLLAPGWTLRRVPGASPVALGGGVGDIASVAAFCLQGQSFLAVTFRERPAADRVELSFDFSQGAVAIVAAHEETAGGAFVAALAGGPLADRLAGRDSEVALSVDGEAQGLLSLSGSTRAVRDALESCRPG
jgi:hypothetical protein